MQGGVDREECRDAQKHRDDDAALVLADEVEHHIGADDDRFHNLAHWNSPLLRVEPSVIIILYLIYTCQVILRL